MVSGSLFPSSISFFATKDEAEDDQDKRKEDNVDEREEDDVDERKEDDADEREEDEIRRSGNPRYHQYSDLLNSQFCQDDLINLRYNSNNLSNSAYNFSNRANNFSNNETDFLNCIGG